MKCFDCGKETTNQAAVFSVDDGTIKMPLCPECNQVNNCQRQLEKLTAIKKANPDKTLSELVRDA